MGKIRRAGDRHLGCGAVRQATCTCAESTRLPTKVGSEVERLGINGKLKKPEAAIAGLKMSLFLEGKGPAHHVSAYASNPDIMTTAGLKKAEGMVQLTLEVAT